MTRALLLAPLLLLGSALFDSSEAAALLRCGGGIVSVDDSVERVTEICGTPDQRFERLVVRRTTHRRPDGTQWTTTRVVHVDAWVFDFGPRRLMQSLTFRDGVLIRIESQGFGTARPRDIQAARRAPRHWVVMPQAARRLRHRSR